MKKLSRCMCGHDERANKVHLVEDYACYAVEDRIVLCNQCWCNAKLTAGIKIPSAFASKEAQEAIINKG